MSRPPPNTTPNSKPREMSLPVHPFPPLPKPHTQTSIGHVSPYNPPLPRAHNTPSSADQYPSSLPPPFPVHGQGGYAPGSGPNPGYRAGAVAAGTIRSGSGTIQNPYDPIPTLGGPSHNPYRPLPIPNHPPQPINQDRRSSSIFPDLNPGGMDGGLVQSPEEEEDDMDVGEDSVNGDEENKGPGAGGGSGRAGGLGAGQGVKKRRPHATRRRVVQSCSECRRRKIKCDKKFPCGPCVLRGDQSRCHEVGMAEKNVNASPSTFATASDLALVAHRLDVLESALIKAGTLSTAELDQQLKYGRSNPIMALHAGIDMDPESRGAEIVKIERGLGLSEAGGVRFADEPNPKSHRQQTTPDRPHPARKIDDPVRRPPQIDDDPDLDVNDDTEGAALTLEHLAFGRSRADGAHSLPHFGGRGQSSISKFAPNNDYHLAKTLPHPHPHHPHRAGSGSPLSASGRALSITASAGNSPADTRRKSSLNVVSLPPPPSPPFDPPPLTHHNSAPEPISGQNKYTDTLSNEDRQMRIDALLDLIGPMDVFELVYRKTDVGLKALTKVLPSRETGELLVKTYLEKVDWLYRCLHVPTFLRQCNDLWAIPNDMVVHEIAMPFVALYFSVCCLGMQFMDADEAPKHFTMDEIRDLPDLWFNAARSSMWAADFVGTHTMEHLQSLLLLGVFMNNRDRGEAAWALLGAGIKMAQGLGLSRLGAEPTSGEAKSLPMWTGRWESLIQREVGRRIWWSYVFLDWALAPSYNFSCSIHPDQIKTALPSNVDDEDIVDGQPIRPKPLSVRTGMSFTLARLQFSTTAYRQIMAANTHRHPPYSFILTTDAELRKAMMDLPAFLQPNPSDKSRQPPPTQDPKTLVRYYEKVMLNLAIHSRMLRLHRPWLAKGYTDERFAYSKEQCIRAARASLRMMSDTHGTAAFLEKWWLPLFYVSVSGLVVIIDLLRTNRRDMQSTETEQKINEVKGALGQMRQIADVSHPSRAAVKVMEFLLAEVEERRRPGSSAGSSVDNGTATGKRKDREEDETDGLQRAVKKLIRQAQLEMDSPEGSSTTIPHTPGSSSLPRHHSSSPFGDRDPAKDRPVFDAYPMPSVPPPSLPPDNQATLGQNTKIAPTTVKVPQQMDNFNPTLGSSNSSNPIIFNPSNPTLSHPHPSLQPFNAPSPFSFPTQGNLNLDLDLNFPHPTSNPAYATSTPLPQLDPSVEDLLANYFQSPLPQNAQQAQSWGTVPDDFLSRVFSFTWDNNTAQAQGQPDLQQQQGMGGIYGTQVPQGQMQGQGQGQGQGGNGMGQGISAQGGVPGSSSGQGQSGGVGGGDGLGGQGIEAFVPFDWGSSGGWMA